MSPTLEEEIVGLDVDDLADPFGKFLLRSGPGRNSGDDVSDDYVLNVEDLLQIGVLAVCPQGCPGLGFYQLCIQP